MKKLMIAAAAAAMVGGAYAVNPITGQLADDTPAVFKLTANGKVSMNMGDYKTVQTLKISKGLIVAKTGTATDTDYVTKTGLVAKVLQGISSCTYTEPVCPPALTNGLVDVEVTYGDPSFTVSKLESQFTDIAVAQAAFKDQTSDVEVSVWDSDHNLVKVGKTSVTLTSGPFSLDSIRYEPMSWPVPQSGEEYCTDCYDTADIYVLAKAAKKTYALKYADVDLTSWTVFGKKYAAFADVAYDGATKYSYKLETEMALAADGLASGTGDTDLDEVCLNMVGFGSATLGQKADKGTAKELCDSQEYCNPVCTAAIKLNGWFVGSYSNNDDPSQADWMCASLYYLYGGTWSATYDSKLSASFTDDADAESYLGASLTDTLE